MKRLIYILPLMLLCACGKPAKSTANAESADSVYSNEYEIRAVDLDIETSFSIDGSYFEFAFPNYKTFTMQSADVDGLYRYVNDKKATCQLTADVRMKIIPINSNDSVLLIGNNIIQLGHKSIWKDQITDSLVNRIYDAINISTPTDRL